MVSASYRRAPRGFTLIELLVVLAIVATLLLLVAPRYWGHVDTAKEAVLRDNLRGTREVIDKFYGDHGRYPDSLDELVDKRYLRALPVDPVTGSATTWTVLSPPAGYEGQVHDLRSGAPGTGKDGSSYADW
ncbi:prepilin-type N-terminal cleavage/methylation domain-containing protein [Ramlibacter sp. AW1]|uniref:Prepilin-type N-terminal cleavage/methylation domain-containing protein n=1 Tax=Ramlibacter aurantiacus TaxID=2801330 RepID=A0A936ZEN7_9BURK|nr:prepilin-type N-terminal cleavage/methylation domain-containing protein [Ramlibacter aurantiacus]MBL0420159.1 prepilin-type N-terminal cleavage/methylation domain-containing protein [Ramlibacter aurantiacus]